jgi:lipoprotein-releasing system permease protein
MIFVSVINMISTLLIIIIEKTNLIGILKAMGSSNWSVRKIFLYNAAYLIGYGLLIGNAFALLLCFIQLQFGILTLDPVSYYVKTVPINLNIFHLLLINGGTILICIIVLIIPTYIITKISPVKAIRME